MAKMCFSLVLAVLVAFSIGHANSVETPPEDEVDGELMYDSSNEEKPVEMPESCAGQSYCFEPGANYPKEIIEELVANMSDLKVENPEPGTNFHSRNGDTYDESDCPHNSSENPIYYIIDKNDKVRVVVQSPKKFQQIYSVKWCQQEGRITRDTPHFLKSSNILRKFNIQCVSAKMDLDFFVLSDKLDPDGKKHIMEVATAKGGIPVCCRCRYSVDD